MVTEVATRSVLVADDDPAFRPLLAMLFDTDDRFTLAGQATNGAEVLELVEATDPDVLLLDIAMPELNGLEVLERLSGRARPAITVLTGFVSAKLAERIRAAGAVFLEKGVSLAQLTDQLADPTRHIREGELVIAWTRPRTWHQNELGGDPYWVEEQVTVIDGGMVVHQLSWDVPLSAEERDTYHRALTTWLRHVER